MHPSCRHNRTVVGFLLLCIGTQSVFAFSVATRQRSTSTRRNAATVMPLDKITPPTPLEAEESKVGVLLLNLGGPETGDDVEGSSFVCTFCLFVLVCRRHLLTLHSSNLQVSCTISLPIPTLFVFRDLSHLSNRLLPCSFPNAVPPSLVRPMHQLAVVLPF